MIVNRTRLRNVNMLELTDLSEAAKRRLPRFVFEFVSGGAGRELALANNASQLQNIQLTPRVLSGVSNPDVSTTLFGKRYSIPAGIAPIGMLGLVRDGAEMTLGRVANERNMPMILSTAATQTIEDVAAVAGSNFWFQFYPTADASLNGNLISRCQSVGCETLVVTVDTPVPGRRHRDARNGLQIPPKVSLKTILQLLARPRWTVARAMAGTPKLANMSSSKSQSAGTLADAMKLLGTPSLTWEDVAKIRDKWQGNLVIKGILDPADAERCLKIGTNGIVISNHGGRQLDCAPAPAQVISECRKAVGDRLTIIADGGIRSGEDVVKLLAIGADFTLIGRPFAYASALGIDMVHSAAELLKDEIINTLALLGVPIEQLTEIHKPSISSARV
jgi:isopentenyl diphosphate isomerase/L-lactate dehydrogenase-like FMN-dependent dehydrogenase